MGYFFDWIDHKWLPIDHERKPTAAQRRRLNRRSDLIVDLITEIERSRDGITVLYAQLLARALVQSDEELMRAHGETVAKLSTEERASKRAPHASS